MKRIVIEFPGRWVLAHRADEKLPVSALCEDLSKEGLQAEALTLTSLAVPSEDPEATKLHVLRVFNNRYQGDEGAISFRVEEAAAPVAEPETGETEEGGEDVSDAISRDFASLFDRIIGSGEEEKPAPSDDVIGNFNDDLTVTGVLQRVDLLVGATEFKDLMHEIAGVLPAVKSNERLQSVLFNRCYLFSIGDGCGLTTYLRAMASLFDAGGVRQMDPFPVVEARLGPFEDKEDTKSFEDVYARLDRGNSRKVRVFGIDIGNWVDHTGHRHFRRLLQRISKSMDEFVVVFRVPFLDKEVLGSLRNSINDMVGTRAVSFAPFNRAEIKRCAELEIDRHGFKVSKNAWDYFDVRISEEKSDGRFYGLNTIRKVTGELLYNKLVDNAKRGKESKLITKGDMKLLCAAPAESKLSGMEQLSRLVGNEQIKKRIEEIVSQIEFARTADEERPCLHMRFVGNPGTGKTTVARILGRILKERGVLRIGNFYEYAGRDLCGQYIGETAPKTASICRDAYGSVLFIDEAYSLYRGDANSRDYGREALDTLIAEMENHRDDFVVIMAGYTDDMERLMEGNKGLASRMPYIVEFPNFSRGQLYEIFVTMTEKFKCDPSLLPAAKAYFDALPEEIISSKEFSNARFVRNLFERTWAKAAMRSQLSKRSQIVLAKEDFERASGEKEFTLNERKKTVIGF